ncbi:YopB/SseC family type III secretion system translocon subunit [Candidatus Ichthyocystis hellenicum]|uniref:YopB/SseC family type III secretion system translocon subunit n=1 Tax=Candidatus Ichthyocystis hellenicum TaxID=1561003 RepID=UPI000B89DA9A|nr:YopB/SseC family type III secretion system translocon subunit [Candidatus Ichthyocystis hellenicum]
MDVTHTFEEVGAAVASSGNQDGQQDVGDNKGDRDSAVAGSDSVGKPDAGKNEVGKVAPEEVHTDSDGHSGSDGGGLYGDRERPGVKDLLGSVGDLLGKDGLTSGPNGIKYPDDLAWLKDVGVQSLMLMVNAETNRNITTLMQGMNVRIEGQAKDMDELHKKNIENIVAATEAAAKANSPFGIFMKIVTAIAMFILAALSVLACVVAPSPVTIIAAIASVLALVNSCLAVASVATGENCTLSGGFLMLGKAIATSLESSGMDEKKAQDIGDTVAGLLGTVSLAFLGDPSILGQFFSGVAKSCGMSDNAAYIFSTVMTAVAMLVMMVVCFKAGGLSSIGSIVDRLGGVGQLTRFAGAIDTAVNGMVCASQGVQSCYGIYAAKKQSDVSVAESLVMVVRAFIQRLRGMQDNDTRDLKEYAKTLGDISKSANEMVKAMCRAEDVAFQQMA